MKRTRESLEADLVLLKKSKKEAEEVVKVWKGKIDEIKGELKDIEDDAAEERAVRVPWSVFVKAATKSGSAWVEIPVDDVYAQYKDCDLSETCWYSGNMDRLNGLALYQLNTLCGKSWTLCDICYNHCDRVFDDYSSYENGREIMVKVDPLQYEPALRAALTKHRCCVGMGCGDCPACYRDCDICNPPYGYVDREDETTRRFMCTCEHKANAPDTPKERAICGKCEGFLNK